MGKKDFALPYSNQKTATMMWTNVHAFFKLHNSFFCMGIALQTICVHFKLKKKVGQSSSLITTAFCDCWHYFHCKIQYKHRTTLSMLTCAAALLEVEESSWTAVTFWPGDARLAPTLTRFIAVERLGTKRVTVTRGTHSTCADAVSLRLEKHRDRDKGAVNGVENRLWIRVKLQTHSSNLETQRL